VKGREFVEIQLLRRLTCHAHARARICHRGNSHRFAYGFLHEFRRFYTVWLRLLQQRIDPATAAICTCWVQHLPCALPRQQTRFAAPDPARRCLSRKIMTVPSQSCARSALFDHQRTRFWSFSSEWRTLEYGWCPETPSTLLSRGDIPVSRVIKGSCGATQSQGTSAVLGASNQAVQGPHSKGHGGKRRMVSHPSCV